MDSIPDPQEPRKEGPASVLIVEDSPVQAELLRRAVEGGGYRVLSAGNGVDGLALARTHRPAVVISDINMPLMDGYAMCHAIRSDEALRDTPVILLTMLSSPEDVIHGLNAGADAYLTKPYNVPSLLSRVASLLANPPEAPPREERRRLQARLADETFMVTANGPRMLSLLLSTYENAVLQNRELAATQQALEDLNQQLEQRVLDQTAALRESERRFRSIFEQAPVGIAESAIDGRLLAINPRMCALTGYSEVELRTLTLGSLTHPEDRALDEACLAELRAGRTAPLAAEKRYRRRDGETVWVSVVVTPVRDAAGVLQKLVTIVEDITSRRQGARDLAEKSGQVAASLRESEALLQEVHHRVKNNLQVISSMLRLEGGRIDHPATRAVLRSMQDRIQSMAVLHETLYRSGEFAHVDAGAYLKRLASHLTRSMMVGASQVRLTLDVVSAGLELDQAISCGLIVNELVSNSLKHGIPEGRAGEIRIELGLVEGGALRLGVRDDGIGLPIDFDEKKGKSLGLQLVFDLARQLRGALTIGPGPGSLFEVTFIPSGSDHGSPRLSGETERPDPETRRRE